MILELTKDSDLVKRVMTDSDIWDKIKIDNIQPDSITVDLPKNMMALTDKFTDV